jgi:ABC-2 type transport system permease protein
MIFLASLRKELIEHLRTSRFLVLAAVFILFGLTSPLLAKFIPEILKAVPGGEQFASLVPTPTMADAIAQYIKNIGQFGILLAFLLSMGAVVNEKEKGTAALVLVKPLPRGYFILTKFLGLVIIFLISIFLAALGGFYYTSLIFSPPDLSAWILMNLLMCLLFLVYVAITLLFSTLMKSQAAVIGLSFATLLLMAGMGAIPSIAPYLPNQLINWGASLLGSTPTSAWPALWVSLAIILACLFTAWFALNRQEL